MKNYSQSYVQELQGTLSSLPWDELNQVIALLHEARFSGRQVFLMGNGGSASTASHFTADLAKNTRREGLPPFRVLGLTDNMAFFSALANDEGYESVFVAQLANFVLPGDLVIAISASGNSPNVLRAVEYAGQVGATTIGFTGFDGGRLGQMVDLHLNVASQVIEQVEDTHLIFQHLIIRSLKDLAAQAAAGRQASEGQLLQPGQGIQGARPSLERLHRVSRELHGDLEVCYLMMRTLQLSLEVVGGLSGSLVQVDDQGALHDAFTIYRGRLLEPNIGQLAQTVEKGLAGWVLENRQAALVTNTQEDPRWLPSTWEQHLPIPRTAISSPILLGEQVSGVLTLVKAPAGQFTQDHLVLLAAIAMLVSSHGKIGQGPSQAE